MLGVVVSAGQHEGEDLPTSFYMCYDVTGKPKRDRAWWTNITMLFCFSNNSNQFDGCCWLESEG